MEIFNVNQREIDQVNIKKGLKSTKPLKVNNKKKKQKDIIMKLIDNLPNHLKDKKRLFTKIERFYRMREGWNIWVKSPRMYQFHGVVHSCCCGLHML